MSGGRWRTVAAAAMVALTVLTLAGCADDAGSGQPSTGFVEGDGTSVILPVEQRQPAPVLRGTDLSGDPVDTATWAGRVGVMNVWASWCAPCRAEAPELQAVHVQRPKTEFLGINTRDSDTAARAFVDRFGITYPNLADPEGRLLLKFSGTLPPQSIPSTLLLDKQGRVAGRFLGPVEAAELDGAIAELQAEPQ